MSEKRALVGNAADKSQVKSAKKKEVSKREMELNDLRAVLNTPQGRRVMWRIMDECRVFGSVWESSAKIHYNSGKQDLGHFIMAEIVSADEKFLLEMMKENKKENMNV